jgi:anti-sigma factor RsiW
VNDAGISDETLAAYADGRLDRDAAARVRAAVAADPALARRLAALHAARAAARPVGASRAEVRRRVVIAAAIAAVAGAVLGAVVAPPPTRLPHPLDPLGPVTPMLVRALDAAASGQEVAFMGGVIRLLASHATASGPCRSFAVESATPAIGLACREADVWRTRLVVGRAITAEGFAPASADDPLLRAQLEELGAGGPLGAEAEQAAIERGWR